MTTDTQKAPGNTPAFIAWHVPDRRTAPWARIGAAWPHRDGKGFTLKLELFPADGGTITLRVYEPEDDAAHGGEGDQS